MGCEPIPLDGVVGTICRPGAMREVVRRPDGEARWCFRCRARREFFFVVRSEVEISYYGPHPSIRCSEGHLDGDLFPGRVREWEG